MNHYSWNDVCELELESDRIPGRSDYERWVFAMFDENGRQVYRDDLTDPEVLSKNTCTVAICPARINGHVPVSYILWPRLADHTFIEKYRFDVPAEFLEHNRDVFDWLQRTPIPDKTVTCDILGGLGNQLFQIITTLVFAKDNRYTPLFDVGRTESPSMVKNRKTYWDSVFKHAVADSLRYRCDFKNQQVWSDPSFTYCRIPGIANHMRLYGYFTSFRYFDHEYEYVNAVVRSNDEITAEVDAVFDEIGETRTSRSKPLVSVHVRRGDSLQNLTLEKPGAGYYRRALSSFNDADFLLFSDDMEWCRANLGEAPNHHFIDGRIDYIDLLLMSKCDHNIIANSTFSWWGAYLNTSPLKRVIYPYPWFKGEKHARDFVDFIPPGWTSLPP